MKLSVFLWTALASLALLLAVTCVRPPAGHCDFTLRMNEIACVRQRINPFDVWNGTVRLPPYYANTHIGKPPEGCTEQVNAYPPWEYVFMLPLSFLPRGAAWPVYCVLMAVSFLAALHFAASRSKDRKLISSVVPLLLISYTIWSNTAVGNFAIIVLAASAGMAWALNNGRTILAGVFWAVVMIKPQIGLPFAIPLLMRRKLSTCTTAAAICLAATAAASVICRSSPVEMLLQGPAANTSFFFGCGTWPYFLCRPETRGADIAIAAAIGAVLCTVMTWMIRRRRDWFVFLMPAAMISSCWTYTQAYSHAMGWFVAFVLVTELIGNPRSGLLWTLAILSSLFLSRWFLAWHGLFMFTGRDFPISEYAFRCVDSINSTCSIAIAFILCVWIGRHPCEQADPA